jgi:hypothetical protein
MCSSKDYPELGLHCNYYENILTAEEMLLFYFFLFLLFFIIFCLFIYLFYFIFFFDKGV